MLNKLFRALNDDTRRRILELLREESLTSGAIADEFDISKPSISHHLDILKQADLIVSQKKGQFVHYSINTSVFDEVFEWLMTFNKKKNGNGEDSS